MRSKDNWLLVFFIFWILFALIATYGAMMTTGVEWSNIFSLSVSFMGFGMMIQKKLRIY